jgi:hypothetical protein
MNLEEMKSLYEKQFGITIDNLEIKKLANGSSIVAFYDPRLGRKRLIDYSNSSELNMIDIDSIRANYNEIIKRIPSNEQYKVTMINKLINQSESREYKYINLENMTALDAKGNIVESALNRNNEVQVGMVNGYEATVNENVIEIPNNLEEQKVDSVQTTSVEINNSITDTKPIEVGTSIISDDGDFRKVVQEEMEKHNIQGSLETEYSKVMEYSNDLSKLESDYANKLIDDNHYVFYKVLTEAYVNTKKLKNVKSMSLVYGPQSGFASVFILAYVAMMISVLALLLINF